MSSRLGVAVMAAALMLYIVVVGWLAVMFLVTGTPVAVGMGVALIVLAPLGLWAMIRELMFGFAADRLGKQLDGEGGMPEAPEALRPSGRLRAEDVGPFVQRYEVEAATAPDDWRARYRLGVVQEAAGHRKDARGSIREAIRLAKTAA